MMQCLMLLAWAGGMVEVHGQGRTANWIFGDGYSLKFTIDSVYSLTHVSGYYAQAATASISDFNSELLFYTNGQKVWDKSGSILEGGDSINSRQNDLGSYSTNGVVILPLPGTVNRFYILSIDDNSRLLTYTLVGINEEGTGQIKPDSLMVPVWDTPVSDQLIAVKHANGRDWWIVARNGFPTNTSFIISLLSTKGFESPRIIDYGILGSSNGEMVASLDGTKILVANVMKSLGIPWVGVFTFDRCLGNISLIDTLTAFTDADEFYGCAFSVSGDVMYVTTGSRHSLYQMWIEDSELRNTLLFRVNLPAMGSILNRCGQLELGPDGKIYMIMMRTDGNPTLSVGLYDEYIACIREPELLGNPDALDTFCIYLNGYQNRTYSLPHFPNYDLGPLVGSPCDTLSPPDTTQVGLPTTPQALDWTWSVTPTVSGSSFQVSSSQPARLVVHDLYGRELLSMDCAGQCGFDLYDHPAGWYIVSLTDRSGQRSEARKVLWQP